MTVTGTLSGFFGAEYNRFMRGLDGLSQTDQERARKLTARDAQNATRPRVVSVPQWDDVFHVTPRLTVTSEQRAEYWRAQRDRRAPNLGREVSHELDRRAAKRDAMQRSAQPEYAQSWGGVMTAVDNVQDFLASVSVLGRVALKISAKVGLRAIPGLGWAMLAADVLNLAMFAGQLAFPAFVALCSGPREGLKAGIGTATTAAFFKGATALVARTSARALVSTPRRLPAAARISGVLGAALVIGQTTDQLFGYGISLGPIVGGIMGATYGAEAAARGVPVEIRSGPSVIHIKPLVQAKLDQLATPALLDRLRAAEIVVTAPLILDVLSPADDEDRLLTLTALLPALETLREDFGGSGWQEFLPALVDWPVPGPAWVYDPVKWWETVDGQGRPRAATWPATWGGTGYEIAIAISSAPGRVAAGLAQLHERLLPQPEAAYVGALVNDLAESLWLLLEDDPDLFRQALTPEWLALDRLARLGLILHPGHTPEEVTPWWTEAVHQVTARRQALKTRAEWAALFDRHQLDYIQLAAPEVIPTAAATETA